MKNKSWIYIAVLTVAIVAIWLWLKPVRNGVIVELGQRSKTNLSTNTLVGGSKTNGIDSASTIPAPLPSSKSVEKNDRDRSPEIFSTFNSTHNVPIEFYGQVIDQDSNPVPNVTVSVSIRQTYMVSPITLDFSSKMVLVNKQSGTDGRFVIQDEKGDGLNLESIQKEGYEPSPKITHTYGATSGSYENPVIVKMWKKGEPAKLVSIQTLFGFKPDGRVYTLDLVSGRKIESENADGDLRVKFQRPSLIKNNEEYSWSLEISAVGGGFVETSDEITYLAPETGYQPQISIQTNAVSPSSMPDITKSYYITSRAGKTYGVVNLQIYADYGGQSAIRVESRMNPNSSRNLQP